MTAGAYTMADTERDAAALHTRRRGRQLADEALATMTGNRPEGFDWSVWSGQAAVILDELTRDG